MADSRIPRPGLSLVYNGLHHNKEMLPTFIEPSWSNRISISLSLLWKKEIKDANYLLEHITRNFIHQGYVNFCINLAVKDIVLTKFPLVYAFVNIPVNVTASETFLRILDKKSGSRASWRLKKVLRMHSFICFYPLIILTIFIVILDINIVLYGYIHVFETGLTSLICCRHHFQRLRHNTEEKQNTQRRA